MLGEGVLAPPWGGVGHAKQTFHSRIIPHKVLAPPWSGKGHAPMIGPDSLPQGGASTPSPHPPHPPPLLHLLSQCWLAHAAHGNVAEPIAALLYAMTCADDSQLENAIKAVLAMGATSGYDLIQGILLACRMGYNE